MKYVYAIIGVLGFWLIIFAGVELNLRFDLNEASIEYWAFVLLISAIALTVKFVFLLKLVPAHSQAPSPE